MRFLTIRDNGGLSIPGMLGRSSNGICKVTAVIVPHGCGAMLLRQALKGKTARIGAAIIGPNSLKLAEIPPSVIGSGRLPAEYFCVTLPMPVTKTVIT